MSPAERAREIVEGCHVPRVPGESYEDCEARWEQTLIDRIAAALADQTAQHRKLVDDTAHVYEELVSLRAEAAQTRALETALGEAIDGYEELYLRFYPEGPKSICVPAWRAALTGAPREPA